MVNSGSVWVLDMTGTHVLDFNSKRAMVSFENKGVRNIELINSGNTFGTGYPIESNEVFRCSDYIGSVYAICSGGSAIITYLQEVTN
jgi:hypothetical protein